METLFGDGSQQQNNSIFNKLLNAGKRMLVGENLFSESLAQFFDKF